MSGNCYSACQKFQFSDRTFYSTFKIESDNIVFESFLLVLRNCGLAAQKFSFPQIMNLFWSFVLIIGWYIKIVDFFVIKTGYGFCRINRFSVDFFVENSN